MDDWRIVPLGAGHDRQAFDCGQPALNTYLQRQASQDVRRRIAQLFVATSADPPNRIAGYYSLSAASFERRDLPAEAAKRLPHYPVPAALLGRLAIDQACQGQGLGELLLLDALHRTLRASAALAVHAMIVDAKDAAAARFYARYGFIAFPSQPLRLFLPMETFARTA